MAVFGLIRQTRASAAARSEDISSKDLEPEEQERSAARKCAGVQFPVRCRFENLREAQLHVIAWQVEVGSQFVCGFTWIELVLLYIRAKLSTHLICSTCSFLSDAQNEGRLPEVNLLSERTSSTVYRQQSLTTRVGLQSKTMP